MRVRQDAALGRRLELVKGWSRRSSWRTPRELEAARAEVARKWSTGEKGWGGSAAAGWGWTPGPWWGRGGRSWPAIGRVLGRYRHLTPREEEAAEYAVLLQKMWDGRFDGT